MSAGGLEILNLHAQGGMAEVYRARATDQSGRTWYYAVKRILPELLKEADMMRMFLEEQRIAACLVHDNIVRVYDVAQADSSSEDGKECFIVMEFLEGKDLAECIEAADEKKRTLPVWFAIHMAREVLKALHHAATEARDKSGRTLGLIHRDVTPHNIFICRDGQVKLTDFGVARVDTAEVRTRAGIIKGKFGYMSPEQLMAGQLDPRSDLYNVGILLYESITAQRLFYGETATQFVAAMMANEVPPLDKKLLVPPELDQLMRRALAKKREDRPPTALAFEAELGRIADKYGLTATRAHLAGELGALFPELAAAAAAEAAAAAAEAAAQQLEQQQAERQAAQAARAQAELQAQVDAQLASAASARAASQDMEGNEPTAIKAPQHGSRGARRQSPAEPQIPRRPPTHAKHLTMMTPAAAMVPAPAHLAHGAQLEPDTLPPDSLGPAAGVFTTSRKSPVAPGPVAPGAPLPGPLGALPPTDQQQSKFPAPQPTASHKSRAQPLPPLPPGTSGGGSGPKPRADRGASTGAPPPGPPRPPALAPEELADATTAPPTGQPARYVPPELRGQAQAQQAQAQAHQQQQQQQAPPAPGAGGAGKGTGKTGKQSRATPPAATPAMAAPPHSAGPPQPAALTPSKEIILGGPTAEDLMPTLLEARPSLEELGLSPDDPDAAGPGPESDELPALDDVPRTEPQRLPARFGEVPTSTAPGMKQADDAQLPDVGDEDGGKTAEVVADPALIAAAARAQGKQPPPPPPPPAPSRAPGPGGTPTVDGKHRVKTGSRRVVSLTDGTDEPSGPKRRPR